MDQMQSHDQDRVNELLDRMLDAYSNVEPLSGLEQRILARLQSESPTRTPKPGRWLLWPITAVMTAGLLLALNLWKIRKLPAPPVPVAHVPMLPLIPAEVSRKNQTHEVPRASRRKMVVPHLPIFPAPAPLTEQEELLLAY